MDDFKKKLLLLHHCRGIGWKMMYMILREDPLLEDLYTKKLQDWHFLFPHVKPNQLSLLFQDLHSIDISQKIKQYEENDVLILTYFDDLYPQRLKHIYNPPWVLYMKGNLNLSLRLPLLLNPPFLSMHFFICIYIFLNFIPTSYFLLY